MGKINFLKIAGAGLAGTTAMTVLVLAGPLMGLSMPGPWESLASFMRVPVALGWIAHLMVGVVLALVYATLVRPHLRGAPWLRGALFAVAPWLMAQVVLMPMMGAGLFAGSAIVAIGSLMGHLVYGGVVGATYGSPQAA